MIYDGIPGKLGTKRYDWAQAIRHPNAYVDGPVSARTIREAARRLLGTGRFTVRAHRASMLAAVRRQIRNGEYDLARTNLRVLVNGRTPRQPTMPVPALP